jgi:hypothetical protein
MNILYYVTQVFDGILKMARQTVETTVLNRDEKWTGLL